MSNTDEHVNRATSVSTVQTRLNRKTGCDKDALVVDPHRLGIVQLHFHLFVQMRAVRKRAVDAQRVVAAGHVAARARTVNALSRSTRTRGDTHRKSKYVD